MLADLDERFSSAVQAFWETRALQQQRQVDSGATDTGTRGAVTGGAQMQAIENLMTEAVIEAGLEQENVKVRTALELPGYYRPEKKWDLLAIVDGQLLMAIEFKSQVGPSFGNNFNNRTEEAIGNAEDIWTAFREDRFGKGQPPFLGYFFLLEDCDKVHDPVRNSEPYFKVDPVFKEASYAKRYSVLLDRLVAERKYTATCLTLSTNAVKPEITFPSKARSFRQFVAAADAHVRAFVNGRM